uniref:Uncharacterized protein n=1 Tax=Vitis vinifera TaxID=29760 RepID=F6I0V0_VITVI
MAHLYNSGHPRLEAHAHATPADQKQTWTLSFNI